MTTSTEVVGKAMEFNDLIRGSRDLSREDVIFLLEELERWKTILFKHL